MPTETVAEHRGGKRRIQKKKLYPGYLMVQMDLTDDVWFVLRETPGFGDFVGVASHADADDRRRGRERPRPDGREQGAAQDVGAATARAIA